MDRFRTIVPVPDSPLKITYETPCLFMGSCFADSIGERMAGLKFPVMLNPFGTLFNPVSMGNNIRRLMDDQPFSENDLHFNDGLWFSYSHYTKFARADRNDSLEAINRAHREAGSWLKTCRYLLVSFGSAQVYVLKETGQVVANCHKVTAKAFIRRLITPVEIIDQYRHLLAELARFNANLQVIFTVSPVRHWKDGAVSNQVSKATLLLALHELLQLPNTHYFPAYEIFMDELRDYRFYAPDMLHPSEQGVGYVWERFCEAWLDESAKKIMAGVTAVMKAVAHRPLQTESPNLKKFTKNALKQMNQLTLNYPFLDFTREKSILTQIHAEDC